MNIDWALAGKVVVVIIVTLWALSAIYLKLEKDHARWLYNRRVNRELKSLLESAVSDRESRRAPDLARDAVIPITDSAWQDRARKAEGLGFLDDDQPELPRAS